MSLLQKLGCWTLIAARLPLGQQHAEQCSHADALRSSLLAHRHLLQSRVANTSDALISGPPDVFSIYVLDAYEALTSGDFPPSMPSPTLTREPPYPETQQPAAPDEPPSNSRVQRTMPAGGTSPSEKLKKLKKSREEAQERTKPDEHRSQFRDMLKHYFRDTRLALVFLSVFVPTWFCILFFIMMIVGRDTGQRDSGPNLDLGRGLTPSVPQTPVRSRPVPLCKELVAPEMDQCSISLPSLRELPSGGDAPTFNIVSKVGKPIVQVKVMQFTDASLLSLQGFKAAAVERLELRSSKLRSLLGSCELHISHKQGNDLPQVQGLIFNGAGEKFATLQCITSEEMAAAIIGTAGWAGLLNGGQQLFLLSPVHPAGTTMLIQGNIAERSVTVEDKNKKQISVVMPGGNVHSTSSGRAAPSVQYYKLRIQPGVDGGSILAALLAIDRWPRLV